MIHCNRNKYPVNFMEQNEDKYVKEVEKKIEDYNRFIDKQCDLSTVMYKLVDTTEQLRRGYDNSDISYETYYNLKNKLERLSGEAHRKCDCKRTKRIK